RRLVPVFALALFLVSRTARADSFDHYTNAILAKVPAAKGTKNVKQLTPTMMVENSRVLPGITAAFLVVKTNDGRMSKLLVQPAQQKVDDGKKLPILLIERFVTFREGEERTIHAQGQNVHLFQGFRFNLDLGQLVPEAVGADLRLVTDGDKVFVEPLGK